MLVLVSVAVTGRGPGIPAPPPRAPRPPPRPAPGGSRGLVGQSIAATLGPLVSLPCAGAARPPASTRTAAAPAAANATHMASRVILVRSVISHLEVDSFIPRITPAV